MERMAKPTLNSGQNPKFRISLGGTTFLKDAEEQVALSLLSLPTAERSPASGFAGEVGGSGLARSRHADSYFLAGPIHHAAADLTV